MPPDANTIVMPLRSVLFEFAVTTNALLVPAGKMAPVAGLVASPPVVTNSKRLAAKVPLPLLVG